MDTADLQLYEAVEKMAPFTRKILVLVGPPGVGRYAIARKMVKYDSKIFETTKAGKLIMDVKKVKGLKTKVIAFSEHASE